MAAEPPERVTLYVGNDGSLSWPSQGPATTAPVDYIRADVHERAVADFARAVEQSHKLIAQGDILIAYNKALRAKLADVAERRGSKP